MRKIAVCLSGQLRNFKDTFPYFKKNIVDELQPDIFIFTDKFENDLNLLYNPIDIGVQTSTITNTFNFKETHGSTNPVSLLNQFYKIASCNKLKQKHEIKENFKYDIVIRCRFDAFFTEKFNENVLCLSPNKIKVPLGWDFKCVSPHAETDIFALGDSNAMNVYSSIYDMLSYYEQEIIFHPESLIGYNLFKNNISVETFKMNFQFHLPEDCSEQKYKYYSLFWDNKQFWYPNK